LRRKNKRWECPETNQERPEASESEANDSIYYHPTANEQEGKSNTQYPDQAEASESTCK
jgi:hypothetical protein